MNGSFQQAQYKFVAFDEHRTPSAAFPNLCAQQGKDLLRALCEGMMKITQTCNKHLFAGKRQSNGE